MKTTILVGDYIICLRIYIYTGINFTYIYIMIIYYIYIIYSVSISLRVPKKPAHNKQKKNTGF